MMITPYERILAVLNKEGPLDRLPKFEIGNGDQKTGTKGRIMWFPPYDIKFTDTAFYNNQDDHIQCSLIE